MSHLETVRGNLEHYLSAGVEERLKQYYDRHPTHLVEELPPGMADPLRVTAEDIVALLVSNVQLTPEAIEALVADREHSLASALRAVPGDVDFVDATHGEIAIGSAARKALEVITSLLGPASGPLTAGVVLSRKRPRLIPVVSPYLMTLLALDLWEPWLDLQGALRSAPDVMRRLRQARLHLERPDMPLMRLLDLAVAASGPPEIRRRSFAP